MIQSIVSDLNSVPSENGISMNCGAYTAKFGPNTENTPVAYAGIVLGFAYTTNTEVQLALVGNTTNIYTRRKSSGEWGSWYTFTGS